MVKSDGSRLHIDAQIPQGEGGALRRATHPKPHQTLTCAQALLFRVVGNMTKNALEACSADGTVTLGCHGGDGVCFWVHNPGEIPHDIQLQIFNRSFSTKGQGRGIGTYSIKLLGEKYLGGTVSFTSNPESGTTFRIVVPRTPA